MKFTTKLLTHIAIVFLAVIMLSCSSSKKMKKKCLDCPEFSYRQPTLVNENL